MWLDSKHIYSCRCLDHNRHTVVTVVRVWFFHCMQLLKLRMLCPTWYHTGMPDSNRLWESGVPVWHHACCFSDISIQRSSRPVLAHRVFIWASSDTDYYCKVTGYWYEACWRSERYAVREPACSMVWTGLLGKHLTESCLLCHFNVTPWYWTRFFPC